jgi:hypothetical protein
MTMLDTSQHSHPQRSISLQERDYLSAVEL